MSLAERIRQVRRALVMVSQTDIMSTAETPVKLVTVGHFSTTVPSENKFIPMEPVTAFCVRENGLDEMPLFNPELLKQLDWESGKATFKHGVSNKNPGEGIIMRPLCVTDYDRGFLQILSQLTRVGEVPRDQFIARFEAMKACPRTYFVTVLEDTRNNRVIGTGALIVEQKFIHSTAERGHIEDVVVSDEYRGKQLGKLLVQTLTLLGKHLGCYKMSLECSEKNQPFYENFGYTRANDNYMIQRYKD